MNITKEMIDRGTAGKLMHEAGFSYEDHYAIAGMLMRFAALVAAAEREACAQICEGLTGRSYEFDMGRLHSAAAIRARSQA